MTVEGDRKLAAVLGLLGAVFIAFDAILDLAWSAYDLVVHRGGGAIAPLDQGLVLLVIAVIAGAFAILGGIRRDGPATVAGAVLIVIAVAGWLAFGLGSGLLSILGTILVLVGGVVFLVSGR
jgi:hypothetical protein